MRAGCGSKSLPRTIPTVVDEIDVAYASVGMDPAVEPGIGWTGWNSVEDTAGWRYRYGSLPGNGPFTWYH